MSSEKPGKQAARAIIVGAGKGLRMNSATPKQFIELKNLPVIAYSLNAFAESSVVDDIYLVVSPEEVQSCRESLLP